MGFHASMVHGASVLCARRVKGIGSMESVAGGRGWFQRTASRRWSHELRFSAHPGVARGSRTDSPSCRTARASVAGVGAESEDLQASRPAAHPSVIPSAPMASSSCNTVAASACGLRD